MDTIRLAKENGYEILATISAEKLTKEDRARVALLLGAKENATADEKEETINSFWTTADDLTDVPQWFIDEQEQNENA
jgi:hypothetical protein